VDEESQDQKQFFRDFGATVEQTVQEVRGFEENYYSLVQRTMPALPWLADFNKKLQSYVRQNFAAAYEFTRELSQAKNVQDSIRIQTDYIQKCGHSFAAQIQDFAGTYMKMASGVIKAPWISSSEE
jgi:hypothetical protein